MNVAPHHSRRTVIALFVLATGALLPMTASADRDRDIREDRELRTSGGGSDRSRNDNRQRDQQRAADDAARRGRDSGGSNGGGDAGRNAEPGTAKASGGGGSTTKTTSPSDARKNEAKQAEDAAKADADNKKEAAKIAEDQAEAQAKAEEDAAEDAEDAAKEAAKDRIESAGRDGGERYVVERGVDGRERLPGEVLVIDRSEATAAVRAAGFSVRSSQSLSSGREALLRIAVPAGQNVEQTVQRLQQLLPSASVAPNHIFRPSQAEVAPARAPQSPARSLAQLNAPTAAAAASPGANGVDMQRAIGILDTGVDTRMPGLARAVVRRQAFAGATYIPRAHGTLVAELAMSQGAPLAVADVFGADGDNRLVAPTDAVAGAIAWLISERVPVINISIEGPDNAVMALLVQRAIASGITVVAAAGNSGPAAAPVYPAAYPGVIAVTAINDRDEVYRRANRGEYISFAAPGVNVVSRAGSYDSQPVSGTSFAAPEVAAVIAYRLTQPRADGRMPPATVVLAELRHAARDLGASGRDPVYGWGAINVDVPAAGAPVSAPSSQPLPQPAAARPMTP